MSPLPYRVPAPPDAEEDDADDSGCPDGDLFPIFVALWVASIVRVSFGVSRGEWFGPELTLATLVVVLLPALSARPLVWLIRPRRRRHH